MRRAGLLFLIAALGAGNGGAEESPPPEGRHLPLNLALWSPASLGDRHDTASVSFSLLYGRLRGVDGLDVSVGASALSDRLRGLQLGGLFGIVGERGAGAQVAGLGSIGGDSFTGLQAAGLASIAGESQRGVQLAGLISVAGEDLEGFQVAGLLSVAGESADGVQLAGLANVAGAEGSVMQGAAGFNVIGDRGDGVQLAGVFNIAGDDFDGLQLGGLFNVTGGTLRGLQVGAGNVAGRSQGLQLGLFNACGECDGFQLGLVNRAKGRNDGVPVGLVNLAENGRIRGLAWAGTSAGFSGGVRFVVGRTYSLLSLGLFEFEGEADTALTPGFHYGVVFPVGGREAFADLGYRYRDVGEAFSHSEEEPDQHVLEARFGVRLPLGERLELLLGGGVSRAFDRGRSFSSGDTAPLLMAGLEF